MEKQDYNMFMTTRKPSDKKSHICTRLIPPKPSWEDLDSFDASFFRSKRNLDQENRNCIASILSTINAVCDKNSELTVPFSIYSQCDYLVLTSFLKDRGFHVEKKIDRGDMLITWYH